MKKIISIAIITSGLLLNGCGYQKDKIQHPQKNNSRIIKQQTTNNK